MILLFRVLMILVVLSERVNNFLSMMCSIFFQQKFFLDLQQRSPILQNEKSVKLGFFEIKFAVIALFRKQKIIATSEDKFHFFRIKNVCNNCDFSWISGWEEYKYQRFSIAFSVLFRKTIFLSKPLCISLLLMYFIGDIFSTSMPKRKSS